MDRFVRPLEQAIFAVDDEFVAIGHLQRIEMLEPIGRNDHRGADVRRGVTKDWAQLESETAISELLKALEDAVYADDSHIWSYSALQKRWSIEGAITISV